MGDSPIFPALFLVLVVCREGRRASAEGVRLARARARRNLLRRGGHYDLLWSGAMNAMAGPALSRRSSKTEYCIENAIEKVVPVQCTTTRGRVKLDWILSNKYTCKNTTYSKVKSLSKQAMPPMAKRPGGGAQARQGARTPKKKLKCV